MINHAFEPEPFGRDACDQKFDDGGRAGYCGKPKAEHLVDTIVAPPKKWPRRVGWKKLQERRKACRHVFGKGRVVESITFAADKCPRCLADEVAYWKARSRSAEGNAAREKSRADMLALHVPAVGSLIVDSIEVHKEALAAEKARADAAEAKAESNRLGYVEALGRARQSQSRAEKAEAALKPQPTTALVTCEYCPDHPHPLNDDGTKCKFPRPAPVSETGKVPAPDLLAAWAVMRMVDDAYWGEFCGCCGVILSLDAADEECGPQHTAVQLVHDWVEKHPEQPVAARAAPQTEELPL